MVPCEATMGTLSKAPKLLVRRHSNNRTMVMASRVGIPVITHTDVWATSQRVCGSTMSTRAQALSSLCYADCSLASMVTRQLPQHQVFK